MAFTVVSLLLGVGQGHGYGYGALIWLYHNRAIDGCLEWLAAGVRAAAR